MTIENMGDEPSPNQEHKTPADVLLAAAELLEKPGAWTVGDFARTGQGTSVWGFHSEATCWCLLGAVQKIADCTTSELPSGVFDALVEVTGTKEPQVWNDAKGRTQSEVVAKLREAAALAREAGQ
jgi:hypothetical protein